MSSPPSVKTKVSGTSVLINSGLINEVTRILVTNGKALPYGLDSENSSKEMIARFNPGGNFEWEENMNKIHISYLRGLGSLLARIVLQNILPIYMNNGVTLDISKMIFAIMKRINFAYARIWSWQWSSFGGFITKTFQHKLQNIATSEPNEVPGGWFSKTTMMKSNAQLHRFHAQVEQAPSV
jgi:hypothetical protein